MKLDLAAKQADLAEKQSKVQMAASNARKAEADAQAAETTLERELMTLPGATQPEIGAALEGMARSIIELRVVMGALIQSSQGTPAPAAPPAATGGTVPAPGDASGAHANRPRAVDRSAVFGRPFQWSRMMSTTETTLMTDAWTDLRATPCTIQLRRGSVRFVVQTSPAPTDLKADHLTLTKKEGSVDIGVSSQNVYARCDDAPGQTARVAVVR